MTDDDRGWHPPDLPPDVPAGDPGAPVRPDALGPRPGPFDPGRPAGPDGPFGRPGDPGVGGIADGGTDRGGIYGGGPHGGNPVFGYGRAYVPAVTDKGARHALILAAVSLLCCGIILGPAAIVEGYRARVRIRDGQGTLVGDGLALGAMILGGIATVLAVAQLSWAIANPLAPTTP